jgi:SAM-dependent methyltransferase
LQWYLAQQGAEVISVDRLDRAALPLRFRRRFRVQGLRKQDLLPDSQTLRRQWAADVPFKNKVTQSARDLLDLLRPLSLSKGSLPKGSLSKGKVILYHQDLRNLVDIADNSLDAIVAVSALEHNSPQGLQEVVAEMMRVLKPGGTLAATLCAARDQDTWHVPSSGWCYTDTSLRRLFDLDVNAPSNYAHYDELFTALRDCAELRDNLASFYSRSGDNGMPWGKWDPQYQPVGVVKVKM